MSFLLQFVLAGLALQLAERFWPVREFADAKEIPLDALALVLALACQLAIPFVAFPWISSIQHWTVVSTSYRYLLTLSPLSAGLFYFLVVDFLVSSVLMALGMMMMPPAIVSLPFKLLLFVLVDGWHLVVKSLVDSFHT